MLVKVYKEDIEIGFNILFLHIGNSKKRAVGGSISSSVIKWGKQNNKQPFKCKSCGILYTRTNKSVKQNNQFVWFKK